MSAPFTWHFRKCFRALLMIFLMHLVTCSFLRGPEANAGESDVSLPSDMVMKWIHRLLTSSSDTSFDFDFDWSDSAWTWINKFKDPSEFDMESGYLEVDRVVVTPTESPVPSLTNYYAEEESYSYNYIYYTYSDDVGVLDDYDNDDDTASSDDVAPSGDDAAYSGDDEYAPFYYYSYTPYYKPFHEHDSDHGNSNETHTLSNDDAYSNYAKRRAYYSSDFPQNDAGIFTDDTSELEPEADLYLPFLTQDDGQLELELLRKKLEDSASVKKEAVPTGDKQ